ncbi:MAG: hypothetical protein ACJ8R9_11260 [Steroidobacteraceae bacterium]
MSLTRAGAAAASAPTLQMEFLSSSAPSGGEDAPKPAAHTAGKRSRSRVRESEFPFPDPADTQLVLLPYERCNNEDFTDSEVVAFHEEAIRHALHSLADGRASEVMRRRVIEWVCVPMVHARELTDLLSFQSMCYAAGYDAEVLQEYVVRRFAPGRLAALGLSR